MATKDQKAQTFGLTWEDENPISYIYYPSEEFSRRNNKVEISTKSSNEKVEKKDENHKINCK